MKKLISIIVSFLGIISIANSQNMALSLDGTNDYVDCGSDASLKISGGAITIEAWIYPTYFNTDLWKNTIVGNDIDAGGSRGYALRYGGAGILNFVFGDGNNWNNEVSSSSNVLKLNVWQHVAVSYTRGSSIIRLYVNGISVATKSTTSNIAASSVNLRIGESGLNNRLMAGKIDEVRIWNDARSDSEIRTNMYKELIGNESNLVAYYKFNETSGTSANDAQTSSRNDGVLTNMTGSEWFPSPAFYGPKRAIKVNGNDYISIPSVFGLGATSVSAECWVNMPSTSEKGTFFHVGNHDGGYGIGVGSGGSYDNSGNELIVLYDMRRWITTGQNIGTGWHHVAYSIDSGGRLIVYLDGVAVYTETGTQTSPIAPSGNSSIGSAQGTTRLFSNGTIDEVRIWNDVRTASEIKKNMNSILLGNESGLVGYYNIDVHPNSYITNLAEDNINVSDGLLNGNPLMLKSTVFNIWLNTNSTSMSTANNWSLGTVPTSSDNVVIPNSGTNPSLSGTVSVKDISINTSTAITGTLTASGKIFNESILTVSGTITNTSSSSEFINNGTLNNTGTISLNDIINSSGQSVNVNGGGEMTVNSDLNNSGTFTINSSSETSSGSLIVKGTSTGNIVYNRYITGNKWHLTASPTVGQSISSFLTSGSNAIVLSGSDYDAMDYDETVDDWTSHYTSGVSGNFIEGKGYCIKRSSSGTVTFTGTVKTSDVSVAITRDNFGWNMLSNPYPSAIGATSDASSTTNFLGVNAESNLDPSYAGLYVWNQDASEYKIINNSGGTLNQDYLQAGQAFFVKSIEGGGNISITEAMQAHQPTVAFGKANPILPPSSKNAWQTIELIVQTEDNNSSTLMKFKEGMTLGLDVSYDSGQFGVSSELSISTKLVEDNGVDFAIQCLPDNTNNIEVPIVLKAESGTEVTFRAETDNLSKDMSVILEDRLLGVFTNLRAHGSSYTETMVNSSSEQRFYLHTQEAALSEIDSDLNNRLRVIPQKDLEQLVIIGIEKNSELYIYSLSGKLIKSYLLKSDVENTLDFKGVKTGIYIVRINNIEQIISKKILW